MGARVELPVGPLFCVIEGPTRGRPWWPTAARAQLRQLGAAAGVRRRFAPHQLRHAHAVELAHEGVPLTVIQRQLGHTNPGVSSIYLQGIDNDRARPPRTDDARHCRARTGRGSALTPLSSDRLPAEPVADDARARREAAARPSDRRLGTALTAAMKIPP